MLSDDLVRHGQHVMTVCNACRYCEAYCPVFQAMEDRKTFAKGDLAYLANLCHNCGECLYACQYAPPHEFGINVPRTLAEIRLASYEEFCWPNVMSRAFTRQPWLAAASLVVGFVAMALAARAFSGVSVPGDFYQVVPHHVMVAVFSAVSLFAIAALVVANVRLRRSIDAVRLKPDAKPAPLVRLKPDPTYGTPSPTVPLKPDPTYGTPPQGGPSYGGPSHGGPSHGGPSYVGSGFSRTDGALTRGLADALTLRHLHGAGENCTNAEESRGPWRRRFHHCTFYGFALCFASTTVAAVYHVLFGWRAPYAYTSLPVVLGTIGGLGLLIGPAGLFAMKSVRDPALGDPAQRGLDTSFIAMLFLTSATGLLLLVFRATSVMPALLVGHLGFVLALFLMLPYGKFVHGLHRMTALVTFAREKGRADP